MPKVENWVVVVIPILTVVLLVVGLFIYLRKRRKNYKIEEEKNDEISLNKTTDSEDENPSIQPVIQQQIDLQAVQAPIENRAYINQSDAESTESEAESSQSDPTIASRTDQVEQNAETQRSQSPVTETETESETESELSIRTKTKLIEKEIRKVRKDIDFLKNCDDSSVTGIL